VLASLLPPFRPRPVKQDIFHFRACILSRSLTPMNGDMIVVQNKNAMGSQPRRQPPIALFSERIA
jgi:hypothetical protein